MECPLSLENAFKRVVSVTNICPTSSGDFMKSHSISPDGSQILISSESNYLACWDLGTSHLRTKYYESDDNRSNSMADEEVPKLTGVFNLGESIYDFLWHPYIDPSSTRSKYYVCTTKDHPVHMMNSSNGKIQCSYNGHNHLDELDPAYSLAFNLDSTKLYTGGNRVIRCFDVENPGKDHTSVATSRSRRDKGGQKGIISCLDFNPDRSGCFAAGSYDRSVGVYVEGERECALLLRDLDFGVTCTKWSACGNMLWVGGRKHDSVVCYDLRHTRQVLGRVSRRLSSNQRMTFSLDPWGKYLATGTESGRLMIYDTSTFAEVNSSQLSNCCLNTVSFHPYSSLIVGTSGQRDFSMHGIDETMDESPAESTKEGSTSSSSWSQLILVEADCKKCVIDASPVDIVNTVYGQN